MHALDEEPGTFWAMDRISTRQRSQLMARVRQRGTTPELKVISLLRRSRIKGYSANKTDLPGQPDIIFPRRKKVIFIHGCFWHGHKCTRGKRPSSNKGFWNEKLDKNKTRDRRVTRKLRLLGWQSLILWECQIKKHDLVSGRIDKFLNHAKRQNNTLRKE